MKLDDTVRFLRAGTLDEPDRVPPDPHIFTSTKQPWLALPEGARFVPEMYALKDDWPADSFARLQAATGLESP